MSAFSVSPSELRTRASALRENNSELSSRIGELSTEEEALIGMWEGTAKDTFNAAFQDDLVQMQNFYELIEKYCQSLETIADNYDKYEEVNTETAKTRTY